MDSSQILRFWGTMTMAERRTIIFHWMETTSVGPGSVAGGDTTLIWNAGRQ